MRSYHILLARVLVFVELKSVVTDSEVLNLSNKIKKFMEVKTDTIHILLIGSQISSTFHHLS